MQSPAAKILLTGATGFLGRHLVAALASRWPAVELCCLVRDPARARALGLSPATLLPGSLDAPLPDCDALRDVEVVVHLAGIVQASDRARMLAVNAQGTANLLAAMPPHARVLHVSSLAAAGPSRDGAGTTAPPDRCRPCSVYGESKRQGELALLADAVRTGRRWLVLRPCLVYGPGDAATELLIRLATSRLCLLPWRHAPLSTVHVRDVTDAIVAALARPNVHGAFVPIAGELSDTHQLSASIVHALLCHARDRGVRRPRLRQLRIRVPTALAAVAGHAADWFARARGRPGYFSRDKVREMDVPGWVADRDLAQELLGFVARVSLYSGFYELAAACRG